MVGERLSVSHNQTGNTSLSYFKGKVIAIETFAFQSEKHRRRLDMPAVGAYFV